jgi:hypothetical protein
MKPPSDFPQATNQNVTVEALEFVDAPSSTIIFANRRHNRTLRKVNVPLMLRSKG